MQYNLLTKYFHLHAFSVQKQTFDRPFSPNWTRLKPLFSKGGGGNYFREHLKEHDFYFFFRLLSLHLCPIILSLYLKSCNNSLLFVICLNCSFLTQVAFCTTKRPSSVSLPPVAQSFLAPLPPDDLCIFPSIKSYCPLY